MAISTSISQIPQGSGCHELINRSNIVTRSFMSIGVGVGFEQQLSHSHVCLSITVIGSTGLAPAFNCLLA
ncbi:unnamed protein product [Dovyalis caffra]|uniref:Uncharacterized protein n=1 Tax=Dovyalis caffra TaxID=77055 RepID=A0AAV1RY41_9ROSI|nr:unnamed protein product [Dovyalis caffra]